MVHSSRRPALQSMGGGWPTKRERAYFDFAITSPIIVKAIHKSVDKGKTGKYTVTKLNVYSKFLSK